MYYLYRTLRLFLQALYALLPVMQWSCKHGMSLAPLLQWCQLVAAQQLLPWSQKCQHDENDTIATLVPTSAHIESIVSNGISTGRVDGIVSTRFK
jgi:hypothetical protein